MKIELRTEVRHASTVASLDAPTDEHGYVEEGELGLSGGNLYIFIDGEEYGSLFFYDENGTPKITLGQLVEEADYEWQDRNPITSPVKFPEEDL